LKSKSCYAGQKRIKSGSRLFCWLIFVNIVTVLF
jgi:hypothetical protein